MELRAIDTTIQVLDDFVFAGIGAAQGNEGFA
jgi:hypothetical protein